MTSARNRSIYPTMLKRLSILVLSCLLWSASQSASAQTAPSSGSGSGTNLSTGPASVQTTDNPIAWSRILDTTERAIARDGITDGDLDMLFDEIGDLREAASARSRVLQSDVKELEQQLKQLGPLPGEGSPAESPEAADLRQSLNQSFAEVDAQLKISLNAAIRARQVLRKISDLQNARFVQSISTRTSGLTSLDFWAEFSRSLQGFGRSIQLFFPGIFSGNGKPDRRRFAGTDPVAGFSFTVGFSVHKNTETSLQT